ncbi:hypothetical protein ACIBHX_16270 [Nonomuraea sp. NPDC050536]|uniref:hypothetical protein n=1 Tax=Nonomuraea sp. NPDC050536 TaxID=3364366 RepID=UPI0037C82262
MSDQFDVIEAGERGRRRWIGLLVVLGLLAVPIIGLLASREPGAVPKPTPTPNPVPSMVVTISGASNVLHPKPVVTGPQASMRVVFPDGRTAEVRYPADVGLEKLGLRPFRGVWVAGQYLELVAPYEGEVEISKGGMPIRKLTSNVTLWPHQPGFPSDGEVLLYTFGRWKMALYDQPEGLEFDQRIAAAGDLRGRVASGGFLVLSGKGIVRMAAPGENARGDPVGPQLWFGGDGGDMLALIPTPDCRHKARMPSVVDGQGRPARFVCRGDVQVAASGDSDFVQRAIAGVRITLK